MRDTMRQIFRNDAASGDRNAANEVSTNRKDVEVGEETSDSECGSVEDQGRKVSSHQNLGIGSSLSATGTSRTSNDSDKSKEPLETEKCWHIGGAKAFLPADSEAEHSQISIANGSNNAFASRRLNRTKFLVLLFLSAAAAAFAYAIYSFSTEQEVTAYQSGFEDASDQAFEVLRVNSADSLDFFQSWSLHLTSSVPDSEASWPFVTVPHFEIQGQDAIQKTGARMVSICPIVSSENRFEWEQYAVENQDWIEESMNASELGGKPVGMRAGLVSNYIYRPTFPRLNASDPLYEDKYLPVWQTAPITTTRDMVNYDFFDYPSVPTLYEAMMASEKPILSETLITNADVTGPPEALLIIPILGPIAANAPIVAVLAALVQWEHYLMHLLPKGTPPLVAVIRNPCTESVSYEIDGASATFLGLGDHQDPAFESDMMVTDLAVFTNVGGCENSVYIYPTQEFYDSYMTNQPIVYACMAVALFLLTAFAFLFYDMMMQRQHKKIVKAATLSNAVVNSLFPANVRSRIIGEQSKKAETETTSSALMKAEDARARSLNNLPRGGKPIADLFPNATVLFADIAGFTAWSSSRDPSQVFTLLEAIYNSFDKIATKCKVFKVETIGDCYVATAGLPDPRDDHAAVMARFTVLCMRRFREVVLELEVSLGPDTAELALRAGLHSGPVTAGVLRGEKSRFQLFGDTVNTAARMESTGERNLIHISQPTADLVISECDELSVKPREQLIEVKGKGKMQTYWLLADNEPEIALDKSIRSETNDESERNGFSYTMFDGDGLSQSINATAASAMPASEKQRRLIDWNVDVLQGLLKKVVAMRKSDSKKPTRKLAKLKIEREEGQMVIDEVKEVINIRSVKSDYKQDPNTVKLGSVVTAQLRDFVTVIAQNYRPNHFHSFEHASHVTQSVIKLLGRIVAPEAIDYDNLTYKRKENAVLHYYTYGITSDPLTQFAAAFSALIHDLDHKGVPNATLVKEGHEEAKRYNNKSVAEQNSVDMAWDILMKPEYVDLRACIYNSKKEFQRFRQLLVNCVMATDIVDKELKALRNKRWDTAFNIAGNASGDDSSTGDLGSSIHSKGDNSIHSKDPLQSSAEDMNRKATIVIEHLIQASDVSHTMQHWHVYQKWNQRFFFECYQAYLDGRSDTDPADGWYKGEIGFFDFYIIPLAKKLKECGVFGVSSDEFLNYAESNKAEWSEKGEELVEQYIAAYKEHVFGGFRKSGPGSTPSMMQNPRFSGPNY